SVSPNGACSRSNRRNRASNETDCSAPWRRSSIHARDVVIGNRRHGGETESVGEAVFGLERRRDVVVGAAGLAETAGRIRFEFLFSRFAGVAAFREAEHMLGVDLGGLVRMLAAIGRRGTGCSEPGQQNQYRP